MRLIDADALLNKTIYNPLHAPYIVEKDIREMPSIQPVATDTNVGDTISRQAAIDALDKIFPADPMRNDYTQGITCGAALATEYIKQLPSAQPEPKEGHWIKRIDPSDGEQYECSECGVLWEFNDGTPEDNEAYYCPNCGAHMKGERQK